MSRLDHSKRDNLLADQGLSPGLKLIAIAIFSVALMVLDHSHDAISPIRDKLTVALAPVQSIAELPSQGLDRFQQYFNQQDLSRENRHLKHKLLQLEGQVQKLASLEAENARIRALMGSAGAIDQNVLLARILATAQEPYRQRITLDKGKKEGIFTGQALIDAHGIVGQVVDVSPHRAHALLISDPNHGVPVENNRTGQQTIVQGTGSLEEMTIPFLPKNADIQIGDTLSSSGLGGRFPAHYPVARVTDIKHIPGQEFLEITAKPMARLGHGRDVLLIWNKQEQAPPQARSVKAKAHHSDSPLPRAADKSHDDEQSHAH